MPHRRELKGVLHNFLGTYTSRHSDHDGYWVFGLAEAQLGNLRVDLVGASTPDSRDPKALTTELARRRFSEQLAKAKIPRSFVCEAQLTVNRSASQTRGFVNDRSVEGHVFTFSVRAVSDRGAGFEDKASVFVAPHDAKLERRSTRRT
jgi:hypothetical protein